MKNPESPFAQLLRSRPSYVAPVAGERIVVVADLHDPDCNSSVIANLIRFVGEWQPQRLVAVASTWCREDPDACVAFAGLLTRLRSVFSGAIVVQANDVPRAGPGSRWSSLCTAALSDLEVGVVSGIYPIAPDWFSLTATGPGGSRYSGAQAIMLARTLQTSIVCNGTSGLAVIGQTSSADGSARTLWGFETGTLSRTAAKAAAGSRPRPELGFGVIAGTNGLAEPIAVPVQRTGSFTFDGEAYAG